MPPRSIPLPRSPLGRSAWLPSSATRTPRPRPVAATRRRDTGFSAATRLAIRTRAGNGDPSAALCEATGVFLGERGGEIQHRRARGRGGSRDPLTNSAANGALLSREAHALAEARDERMRAEGWWIPSWVSPLDEPVLLHCADGGLTVWLSEDGQYLLKPPGRAA